MLRLQCSDRIRERLLEEFIDANDLIPINNGTRSTFSSSQEKSIIDVTMATHKLSTLIKGWRVDDQTENMTDYKTIYFEISRHLLKAQSIGLFGK